MEKRTQQPKEEQPEVRLQEKFSIYTQTPEYLSAREAAKKQGFGALKRFDDNAQTAFFSGKTVADRTRAQQQLESLLTNANYANARQFAGLTASSGGAVTSAIQKGDSATADRLMDNIASGKIKSSDDVLSFMSSLGYTSFVKTELARLAAYKATELKQQMALFEVSNERTDAAQYAREFALSLRELTRYVPESKDEFERYAGMFNEIAALGKEVKMDGTVGAEIKKTALDITKNLDRLLGSVVAESNKTIEATVKDTAKLGRHKLTATELPKIKIKPEPSAVTRFDGRAEQKENEREPKREDTKLGTREETETVFEPHGTDGFDGEPHDGLEPLSTDVKPYETRTIINSPSKPL